MQSHENELAALAEKVAIAAHYQIPEWTARVEELDAVFSGVDKDWVRTYMADVRARDPEVFEALDSLAGADRLGCVRLVLRVLEKREEDHVVRQETR
jgi:hypothetical protein